MEQGTCLRTNRVVALKKFKTSKEKEGKRLTMFNQAENEIKLLKAIKHPTCVEYIDSFAMGKTMVLVQEFVSGGDLMERIQRLRVIPEAESGIVMRQLLTGVSFLHKSDICHRDIKPENVLMMSADPSSPDFWRVKLADFGLGSPHAQGYSDCLASLRGTPEYAAPEMLQVIMSPNATYSSKVDIWSLGCVLFTMLSGRQPFSKGENYAAMFDRVLKGKLDVSGRVWDTVSHEAKYTMQKMVEVDPDKRPTARQCLQGAWLRSTKWMETRALKWKNFNATTNSFENPHKDESANQNGEGTANNVNNWVEEDGLADENSMTMAFSKAMDTGFSRLPSVRSADLNKA